MKLNTIFTIAKKEFFGFFNSPLAYTVIVPFLLISVFIYFRSVLTGGEATLRPYFDLLPWFLLLVAPALSMKLLTDEYKSSTFELLFAHPISELEIILGKFLGALSFFVLLLAATIGLPITILAYSKADPGLIISQYIGAAFVGGAFLAIGIATSSYTKNAISSFLLAASAGFILIIIGMDMITLMIPGPFNLIVLDLSLLTHIENLARGLLDIRDIAYFVTLIGLFLWAAVYKLSERRLAEDRKEKNKLRLAFILIIAIGILVNVYLAYFPARIDLTESGLFTLSDGTKQTIRGLPDILTITLYASKDLPAQVQLTRQQITDLLKDYEKLNRNIQVKTVTPDDTPEAQQDVQMTGIRQMQFNKIGAGKFETQAGFLGLALRYGDKTDSIPFIEDTSDLEYQLTRRIRKITNKKDQVIGIYTNGKAQNQLINELLSTQYSLNPVNLDNDKSLPDLAALIVIDDGSSPASTASAVIKQYLKNGGKALFLVNGVNVDKQTMSAKISQSGIPGILKDYGISLGNDLIYDLQLNETLGFTVGDRHVFASYPFWLHALPASNAAGAGSNAAGAIDSDFSALKTVKSITLAWPSSIQIENRSGYTAKRILTTSEAGGRQTGNFEISPAYFQTASPTTGEKYVLAAALEGKESRIVVVGTNSLADDNILRNSRDNAAFLSNTVDYLAVDKNIASIPSKVSGNALFEFKNPQEIQTVQYSNIIIPPVVITLFAIWHLRRRSIKTRRVYEK